MTSESQNQDAQKAKSAEALVAEPPFIAVFEFMQNPIFPQARIVYVSRVSAGEPTAEVIAPESAI